MAASLSEGQKARGADLIPNSATQTLVKFAVNLSANCTDCQQLILFSIGVAFFATKLKNTNCEAGVNNFLLFSNFFPLLTADL